MELLQIILAAIGFIGSIIAMFLSLKKTFKNRAILVVDDEKDVREKLQKVLERRLPNFTIYPASTLEEAKEIVKNKKLFSAIIDIQLGRTDSLEYGGVDIFQYVNQKQPKAELVMISGYHSIEDAEEHYPQQGKPVNKDMWNKMKNSFISKGGDENYISAILKRLLRKV